MRVYAQGWGIVGRLSQFVFAGTIMCALHTVASADTNTNVVAER